MLFLDDIGKVISLNAIEGVQPWHQAHSFVRGHWSVKAKSSPMILAKSCHDMDILAWLINSPHTDLSSYGALTYFRAENAPTGAPARCTDGCPVADSCRYHAALYCKPEGRRWLGMVYDRAKEAPDSEILEWLKTSPWGSLRLPMRQRCRRSSGHRCTFCQRCDRHLYNDGV